MTTGALPAGPTRGMTCKRCGCLLMAPEWSEDFSEEGVILSLWSCSNCGHAFETEAPAPLGASCKTEPEPLEEPLLSLLVA